MSAPRGRRLAAAAALAVAVAGCGVGPGPRSEGEATLAVTRDYGARPLLEAAVSDPPESETVLRFLDREAEITTRFGGGFVQSIEGVAGTIERGRRFDWFFFVDGIESELGAAEREVRAGQRIWWDHRDWTDAMRVPAVVGSWPEPFAQAAAEDDPEPVRVLCAGPPPPCETASERLADAGVEAAVSELSRGDAARGPRLLVGPWARIADDPAAAELEGGPARSGVFARFLPRPGGGTALAALDERADVAREIGAGGGLVAALRRGEGPVTWLITGVDRAGVAEAAAALDADSLAGRYAIALDGPQALRLPVVEDAG